MNSLHQNDLGRALTPFSDSSPASRQERQNGDQFLTPNTPTPAAHIALQTILVPTDFSSLTRQSIEYGRWFAEQFGGHLLLLHAIEAVEYLPNYRIDSLAEIRAIRRNTAETQFALLTRDFAAIRPLSRAACRAEIVEGDPASETNRIAGESDADLIIIATRGRTGIDRWLSPGTTARVVRRAPCPVLIVRQNQGSLGPSAPLFHLENILVPLDFSDRALKGLRYAVRFAQQFGARITLVHVMTPPICPSDFPYPGPQGEESFEIVRKQLEDLRANSIPSDVPVEIVVRQGSAFEGILEVAREIKADLLISTTHGYTGLKHLLLGSTAEKIVQHAPCPVLVVREQEHDFVEVG